MYIALGVFALVALWLLITYNGIVGRKNAVKAGFSNIDVELKRRYDLIPNLVETAKKYMSHESGTLTAVVAARSDALGAIAALRKDPFDPQAIKKLGEADRQLNQTLYSFKAVAENYPDLKADRLMEKTMSELADTENRIAFMRQNYNDLVTNYNTVLEIFPNVILVRQFNFAPASLWTIERAEEREAVKVQF